MARSDRIPVTPEKQTGTLRQDIGLDSSVFDDIDCTPNTRRQLISLKRKASELSEQASPTITSPFLKWRLAVMEAQLRVRAVQKVKGNGLSLQRKIEEAFDNCWIVIVPVDSVASTPTEWKVVLLNTAEKDNVFFTDIYKQSGQALWRWRDIDGRKLSFCNDNRPARRIHALYVGVAARQGQTLGRLRREGPPGRVWAAPNKPDGYLRKSILVQLGKKMGDILPEELISAGNKCWYIRGP